MPNHCHDANTPGSTIVVVSSASPASSASRLLNLPAEHVGRAARIRAAVVHAVLVVVDDGAYRAREPGPVVPLVDLVPHVPQLLAELFREALLHVQPPGIVLVRLERAREAVAGEARRFHRGLDR